MFPSTIIVVWIHHIYWWDFWSRGNFLRCGLFSVSSSRMESFPYEVFSSVRVLRKDSHSSFKIWDFKRITLFLLDWMRFWSRPFLRSQDFSLPPRGYFRLLWLEREIEVEIGIWWVSLFSLNWRKSQIFRFFESNFLFLFSSKKTGPEFFFLFPKIEILAPYFFFSSILPFGTSPVPASSFRILFFRDNDNIVMTMRDTILDICHKRCERRACKISGWV